ncbi:hypothetical protein YC2023_050229 [Brassica napus]
MEIILGGKGVRRGLTNLTPKLLVQEKFHIRLQEKEGSFELMVQDGGHEMKEKEVGDDPNSQFQQQSWPVSQNAKGINLTRGRLDPLCGAMGRYLCVEASLRNAGHEIVELLVQDTQEEDLIHCVEQWEGACV